MAKYQVKYCNCIASVFFIGMIITTTLINSALSYDGECQLVAGTAVNLREGPSQKSPSTMHLPYGTVCRVEERVGHWLRVVLRDFPTIAGFVHKTVMRSLNEPMPERDQKIIKQFKEKLVAPSSFVDWARHTDDLLPDTPPDFFLRPMLKRQHEALERWIYWEKELVPIKYRIWVLRLLGQRLFRFGGVYRNTPEAVLNASAIYQLPTAAYKLARNAGAWKHQIETPNVGSSFFLELPRHLLFINATKNSGGVVVRDNEMAEKNGNPPYGGFFAEDVLFVHLLSTYFDKKQAFHLVRRDSSLILECSDKVQVAVSDISGKNVRLFHTGIEFYIGTGEIRLPDIRHQRTRMLVFFGQPSVIDMVTEHERFVVNVKPQDKEWSTRIEVDFDRDGAIDMIRTVELTFDDSFDPMGNFNLVFSYNISGKWQTVMKQRVALVP